MASLGIRKAVSRSFTHNQLLFTISPLSPCSSVHTQNSCVVLINRTMGTCKSAKPKEPKRLVTPVKEAYRFMYDCFLAVETPEKHADIVAKILLEADYRGYYSHGMNRLEAYLKDIENKMANPKAVCTIDKESAATAVVNGNNGMGAVVGTFCMDLAIKKAKEIGIAMVVARNSNHFGIASVYGVQAIKQKVIGMILSNTSPLMVPIGAKETALGTNPISLGAPGNCSDYFILDMATTAVAVGKIELHKRKGIPIPPGWATNDDGKTETNAEVALKSKKLMPLGGEGSNGGYKGYGLAILVEVLSGLLSGSAYGPHIRQWGQTNKLANLGHGFLAINPAFFADGFEDRLTDLMERLRKLSPVDPSKPVMVHGDVERNHMKRVDADGGLLYVKNQHDTNEKLAKKLNVKPMISK